MMSGDGGSDLRMVTIGCFLGSGFLFYYAGAGHDSQQLLRSVRTEPMVEVVEMMMMILVVAAVAMVVMDGGKCGHLSCMLIISHHSPIPSFLPHNLSPYLIHLLFQLLLPGLDDRTSSRQRVSNQYRNVIAKRQFRSGTGSGVGQ